ncbi:MAG: TerC family protein [Ktedonobacteraceae bacterium]
MADWEWAGMFGSILLLDLVLSGDNALVLGAAAARLPRKQRIYALLFGGGGAIALRIALSSIATIVLNIPWIQTAGAIVLMVIAIRLLGEREQLQRATAEEQSSGLLKKLQPGRENFKTAALTIFIADITMSLDNVLAVGAAANGAFLPMALGLLVSIIIILCGSALIAELMARFTWLLDIAALVLAWTGGTMIRDDLLTLHIINANLEIASPNSIPLAACVCMGFILFYFHLHSWWCSRQK